jgi:hypothetical protein
MSDLGKLSLMAWAEREELASLELVDMLALAVMFVARTESTDMTLDKGFVWISDYWVDVWGGSIVKRTKTCSSSGGDVDLKEGLI